MAKIELTFVGVTDTVDPDKKKLDYRIDLTMTTGSEHREAYCYYDATWKKVFLNSTKPSEKGSGVISFALNIQNIRFEKQMYSPNKIIADIQIDAGTPRNSVPDSKAVYFASISRIDLQKSFIKKKVILKCDDKVVCDDYFIQDIVPTYKQDGMYVTFMMYSPDYQLTQEEYCRTFVSKKLGADILTGEIGNYKLPYDPKTSVAFSYDNMQHIKLVKDDKLGNKAGSEHVFPYLVQYNESFYDFLKRTTNRWGEFMYYEDKKLRMGYGYAPEANTDYKNSAASATFKDLTEYKKKQENAGKFNSEAPIDEQISKNYLTKDKYDIVKTRMNSILPSNYKTLDGDIYVVKKLAALLNNDKTIFQFLVDTGIDDYIDYEKAKEVSKPKNEDFNKDYFNNDSTQGRAETRFDTTQYGEKDGDKKFNQFSEFNPILNAETYINIVEKEFAAGRNAIELNFDTTYPDIKLGQVITYDNATYLVVKVEGYQPEKLVIIQNIRVEQQVDMDNVNFKTAVPLCRVYKEEEQDVEVTDPETGEKKTEKKKVKVYDYTYYPPVIAEGHIKRSGPQLATITEGTKDDPLRYNRVRIKYDWQGDKEWSSPWLLFSPGGGSSKSGVYTWHLKGQRVMVDYIAGNIERPYVVSSMEFNQPAQMKTYQQVLQTPWEHKLLMTDGAGAGATAMLASFNPGLKLLQGFWPTAQLPGLDFEKSENLEGNIEMTDKYGFFSIKGSTDERNISIKSPWGDVKINAFTGISISAPNGDVKIKGKNVSIEAGGNLTLTSGKNIKQKFLMDGEDLNVVSVAATITEMCTAKLASLAVNVTDLSLLRHILEVAFKPVEGKLQITAGRYLMLEAGGKKTGYPIDAYKDFFKDMKAKPEAEDKICVESFELLRGLIDSNLNNQREIYRDARSKKSILNQALLDCRNIRGEMQTNGIEDIIKALWQNPAADAEQTAGFKGQYRNIEDNEEIDWSVMSRFLGPQAMKRYYNKPEAERRQQWAVALQRQRHHKEIIKYCITDLGQAIQKLKDFQLSKAAKKYEKLNALMQPNKMPNECLLGGGIEQNEKFKLFKRNYPASAALKKLIYRKLCIELVKSYKFNRAALEGGGLLTQPTVFPEPAYTCSDEDWAKYVRSIQSLSRKDERSKTQKFFDSAWKSFSDPFKGVLDIKGIINAFDDWTYGSSKKGQILFGSPDGTMVLDRNIYRANVAGEDDFDRGADKPQGNGHATRIRNAMLNANF